MNKSNTLSILIYNVHKSEDTVMASMLRHETAAEMDVGVTQKR